MSSLGVDHAQQLVAAVAVRLREAGAAVRSLAPPHPKAADFARRRRAADRGDPRSHRRPRLRPVHVVRAGCAKCTVCCASGWRSNQSPGRPAALGTVGTGSGPRVTRCCSRRATFWEGIDVVGDALSCVVIDRLPFPSPSEPLVAARIAAPRSPGPLGVRALHDPQRHRVASNRDFGRLIRSTTDRGVVALLDGRATSMRYGATIIDALPPATRIDDLALLDELFRR